MSEGLRQYLVADASARDDGNRFLICCPFCGLETWAYYTSLHGSGKRCHCGAVHHAYGTTPPPEEDA